MYNLEVGKKFLINTGKLGNTKEKSSRIIIRNFCVGSHKQNQQIVVWGRTFIPQMTDEWLIFKM